MTTLDIAVSRYDHTAGLFDGSVWIEGAEARMHTADIPSDIFEKMLRDTAYDAAELGLTYLLRLIDEGDDRFIALPVFLAREFRHSAIYINTHAGITRPQDLAGRTVGEFGMYGHDGGVWPKGILSDDFGFDPANCRWVVGATDWYMPPFDFIAQPHPADVDVQPIHEWVVGIGLPAQDYGTHSLRRTKASIIYKATGNLRAVQILLGHAKIDSTVRYLGVDVEDALELAERTEV